MAELSSLLFLMNVNRNHGDQPEHNSGEVGNDDRPILIGLAPAVAHPERGVRGRNQWLQGGTGLPEKFAIIWGM